MTPFSPSPRDGHDFASPSFAPVSADPDVFTAVPAETAQRFAELDHQHHRHAAQTRSVRLRTIEQIHRRP